jgi:transcriptional regulator with XRE-family HTH domain
MKGYERGNLRKELDEAMLPFRLAQQRKGGATGRGKTGQGKTGRGETGWLRSIRQAVGVPVDEVARRLGVCRWEVHRLEESEQNSRIMLATLSRAAKGLGCELVYALVPMKGSLEDLATEQRLVGEMALKDKRAARVLKEKPWLEAIGWREKFQNAMRTMLRRDGYRVRPRKTERGVAKQMAEYKETLKLVGRGKGRD